MTDEEIHERLQFVSPANRESGGWCHAGGILNFRKVGHIVEHPNYAFPHLILPDQTSCVYCGADLER